MVGKSSGTLMVMFWISSDKRIKKNIRDIDGITALSQIRKIQPKIYNYIDFTNGNQDIYGFIAQDVEEVFPQWVNNAVTINDDEKDELPEGETSKTLDLPFEFNAYVVEAIKELNNKHETEKTVMQNRITELETQNAQLVADIAAIKAHLGL